MLQSYDNKDGMGFGRKKTYRSMVKIEDPAIYTHKYSQLTFDKDASEIQWSNNGHSQQMLLGKNRSPFAKICI